MVVKIRTCKKCFTVSTQYYISDNMLCQKCAYLPIPKEDLWQKIKTAPSRWKAKVIKKIFYRW